MYRTFADREAVLFGQVLLPYVRQRNPDARARLQEELVELAALGRRLRSALLRDAVRESLSRVSAPAPRRRLPRCSTRKPSATASLASRPRSRQTTPTAWSSSVY